MKNKIRELKEKVVGLVGQCRALLEKAESEDRNLTPEEQAQYDTIEKDVKGNQQRAERMEKQMKAEENLEELASDPNKPQPGGDDTRAEVHPTDKPEYRKAFTSFIKNGFIGPELRALQADAPAAGGFIVVPQEFIKKLIKAIDDFVFLRGLATVIPLTQAGSIGVPSLDADPADADWTSELKIGSEDSTMSFGKREMKTWPLAKYIKLSNKLLRIAALSPEELVRSRLAYKFAITEEKAFMSGSGANRPLGVFTASDDGIGTGRDITAASTTVWTFDELINVKYNLKAQYQGRSVWIFHRDGIRNTMKLKDGNGQYIWQPSVVVGQPDRLLDRPFYMSEYAPNTYSAANYVCIFGDFSNYWIVDSLEFAIQRLVELYAGTNQTGFIGRKETDGMPVLSEAFSRLILHA